MSIWDDEPKRDERRPLPKDEPGAPSAAAIAVARLGKAHDNVRAAAQRDATEIVARARRDIRRVVTEARRELLELSAQVQAANVELQDTALPDPSVIEVHDVPLHSPAGWDTPPAPEPGLGYSVPDDEDEPASGIAPGLPGSARVFVAIFTLVGIAVLAGTVWWLSRGQVVPRPSSTVADVALAASNPPAEAPIGEPLPGPAELPVAFAADPLAPPAPDPGPAVVVASPPAAALPRPAPPTTAASPSSMGAAPSPGAVATAPAPAAALARPMPAPPPPIPAPASGTPAASPSAPTTMPPPPPAAAGRGTAAARVDIAAFGRQWLDAYHRQDRSAMEPVVAPSLVINDERKADQRFPFGLEVSRAFEDEQLQLSGDSAVFSVRMTERASTGAFVSHVSQTWVRRLGEWQLQEARISSEGRAEAEGR